MSARAVDSMRSTGLTLRRQTRNIRHACLFLDTGALGAVFTKETPTIPRRHHFRLQRAVAFAHTSQAIQQCLAANRLALG